MTARFQSFRETALALRPRVAIILGSGLTGASRQFEPICTLGYEDVPGLVPPTVAGHKGQLAIGTWATVPLLLFSGRIHFYEGHSWDRVTNTVRIAADLGVQTLILTNAAGGIHAALVPGSLMLIRQHLKLLEPNAWKTLDNPSAESCYSPRLIAQVLRFEPEIFVGTYAALTGPCYETPAEIRALRTVRADAVGMSTAIEAETAHSLGLEVLGLSSITNKAAGMSDGPLSHKEVEFHAKQISERVGTVLTQLLMGL